MLVSRVPLRDTFRNVPVEREKPVVIKCLFLNAGLWMEKRESIYKKSPKNVSRGVAALHTSLLKMSTLINMDMANLGRTIKASRKFSLKRPLVIRKKGVLCAETSSRLGAGIFLQGCGPPQHQSCGVFLLHRWNFSSSFLKTLFIYFGKEGKERERERNINLWLPLVSPLTGTWPTTQACALTGNQTGGPLVHRPALSPLSHTSQR